MGSGSCRRELDRVRIFSRHGHGWSILADRSLADKWMRKVDYDSAGAKPARAGAFTRFAQMFAKLAGRPITVILAGVIILVWIAVGPVYHFSETWLLAINTATTVITFLMVFLIQHSQTRDTAAIQLKLSEILLAMEGATNRVAAIEHASDEELALLQEEHRQKSAK
jgi:low affinity Fe/Cu permease